LLYPSIKDTILNIGEDDKFNIGEGVELRVIETPGHYWDHCCFLMEKRDGKNVLFTGDHILGSKSVFLLCDYSIMFRPRMLTMVNT
jgi:glyoxylase-like metal-dependent hydrolase (beta-lactamase superfamily II)